MHNRACLNQCCGVQAACEYTKPGPSRPRLARPHACTQQQHSQGTRDASRVKARIRSRASWAMQHAALRHPHSAKPLPPSRRIVPSPRRAARRAKAVPAAATAAVRQRASASPPTRRTRAPVRPRAPRARDARCALARPVPSSLSRLAARAAAPRHRAPLMAAEKLAGRPPASPSPPPSSAYK